MSYHQITSEERYMISALRLQGFHDAEIARQLGRDRSTIGRETKRNGCNDGFYRPSKAITRTRWHDVSRADSGISPMAICKWSVRCFVWYDRMYGGYLYTHLRQAGKKWRKRYRSPDSRGVLPGKRHISERPLGATNRSRIGHWEIDTVMGGKDLHCIVTIVERKTKYTLIGKLKARTTAELNRSVIKLINKQVRRVRSITADNGTEFHAYDEIETRTGTPFYFAKPHHSWERGLNENTNGLIRQYLPKRKSMANLTQPECNIIAMKLNRRPRKSLGFKTPEQCYAAA